MKLFILEVYMGDRWRPRSFFTGDYRAIVATIGDSFTAACRLRRVPSQEEYRSLESYMVFMLASGGESCPSNLIVSLDCLVFDLVDWVVA